MINDDAFTPGNNVEVALCRVLLEAVRRVQSAGVDPMKVRYEVRIAPRSNEEVGWVTIPVGSLPMQKLD